MHRYLWAVEDDASAFEFQPIWPWSALYNLRALARRTAMTPGAAVAYEAARLLVVEKGVRGEYRVRPSRPWWEHAVAIWFSRHYSAEQLIVWVADHQQFGRSSVGIDAAARAYFGKAPGSLTLAEAAMLIGLPQSPRRYDPTCRPEQARRRRSYVLKRLRGHRLISASEEEDADRETFVALARAC